MKKKIKRDEEKSKETKNNLRIEHIINDIIFEKTTYLLSVLL